MLHKLRESIAEWWHWTWNTIVDNDMEGLKLLMDLFGGGLLLLVVGAVLAGTYSAVRAIAKTNEEAAIYICMGIVFAPGIWLWLTFFSKKNRPAQNPRNKISSDLSVAPSSLSKPEQSRSKAYDGHVYLIREEFGQYKIGRTVDVPTRFNTLKIQIPQKIEIVWSIKCYNHKRAERNLHRIYKPSRTKGEWFSLTPEQVRDINRLTDAQLG